MQSIAMVVLSPFNGVPDQKSPGSLIRTDDDGVPSLVQLLQYDRPTGLFRAIFFDGSNALIPANIRLTMFGNPIPQPNFGEWGEAEDRATIWYWKMAGIKQSFVKHET